MVKFSLKHRLDFLTGRFLSLATLSGAVVLLMCCAFSAAARAASNEVVVKPGVLPVPITINKFYEFPLVVSDANGAGVPGLGLKIRGRMPEHAHGLPTEPQIVDEGEGRYRVKGLSFNMPGQWVIEILRDGDLLFRQKFMVRF
ncbi:MAG: FixH family protein [Burkholderiaceae bacterium]|jgi:hypothetical protein|nr:FixH family protein [Burkholderiaceae bacterium]